jgi:hypothetical protein
LSFSLAGLSRGGVVVDATGVATTVLTGGEAIVGLEAGVETRGLVVAVEVSFDSVGLIIEGDPKLPLAVDDNDVTVVVVVAVVVVF